jgi:CDP-glucose 4,6-dehydratase
MEDLDVIDASTPNPEFWRGKRVLLTGHTGFKGAWMALWLSRLGADVTGISLPPETSPNLFELANIRETTHSHFCDIRNASELATLISSAEPEIVFHLAAQSLVRPSYRNPLETFSINVQGTANVLDSLRPLSRLRVVVAVTTDKVYKNLEQHQPFRETDELGGHDPYSASKAAAEIVVSSYRDSYLAAKGVALASARAGNVIGGGDWSEDRLLPDAIRAWQASQSIQVRYPHAIRPWQHVLEPLAGYIKLAELLWQRRNAAGAYNFGPDAEDATSVGNILRVAQQVYGMGAIEWCDASNDPYETDRLTLDVTKTRKVLGVKPRWTLTQAVERTIKWYRQQQEGADASKLCLADLTAFVDTQMAVPHA